MDFAKRIFVGITSHGDGSWRRKLKEIDELGITQAALFLEEIPTKKEREEVYAAVEKSGLRKIPLVHIRNEMDADELHYICERYKNPCLTIHENSFPYLDKWRGFHKNLYVEMNFDNKVASMVQVEEIGGFCIDLSHFKAAEEKWTKDFLYVLEHQKKKYFVCNHLNGYSPKKITDKHVITDLHDFDYLRTLPEFVFGDVIALECYNTIHEQVRFREYLIKLLNS